MLDYGRYFSIIHRYGRILLAGEQGENKLPGRFIPYMRLISENPGTSQDYIAKSLKIDKGNVARTLKIMEREGMVERQPGKKDRRCYEVYPTDKLLSITDSCARQVDKLQKILVAGISREDMEVFDRVLDRMCDNVVSSVSDEKIREFESEMERKMMKAIGKRIEEEKKGEK